MPCSLGESRPSGHYETRERRENEFNKGAVRKLLHRLHGIREDGPADLNPKFR